MNHTDQNPITVTAVQLNSQQDVDANLSAIKSAITEASDKGAGLVVLPENCCSMGAQNATAERFDEISTTLAYYAREHHIYLLAGTLPCFSRPDGTIVPDGRLRQVSQLFAPDGTQIARYDKIHLFTATVADKQGSYNEAATFEPGTQTVVAPIEIKGRIYQLGMMVCFDLRFPALAQRLRQAGADVLSAPSAFTYMTGQAHWSLLLQARALDSQCMVIGAAQGGEHFGKNGNSRQTWGHSAITDYSGKVITSYDHSAFDHSNHNDANIKDYALVSATLNQSAQADARQEMPIFACHRLA